MTSTRTKNLARAIQRANPDMKYTEALRHAEAGRIVLDPMDPHTEAVAEMYRAAGIEMTPIDLSASNGDEPLDPTAFSTHFPLKPAAEAREELRVARERLDPFKVVLDLSPSLWDGGGDTPSSPLTFLVGHRLDTGEPMHLTLEGQSAHILTSGSTASGKTSLAEIIAAQNLVRPMPWDPSLHGTVVIVDSKGPLAHRWEGRPGVIVANGAKDAAQPDAEGNPVTGPLVVASAMEWIEAEHRRRASVLAQHKTATTWLDLPDEVKRRERLSPMIVVLDEYPVHIDVEVANGDERVERENFARRATAHLANWHVRRYRNVGMHTIAVAQDAKASTMGAEFLRNLPVRVATGQMSQMQLRSIFGDREDIPSIETTRSATEAGEGRAKAIPGRARIMTSRDEEIGTIQVPWFGGKTNMDALDKWLPRGEVPPNGDFTLPSGKPRQEG